MRMSVRRLFAATWLAAVGIVCPSIASAQSERPMMDPDSPVQCLKDAQGDVWRIQCNAAARTCLYAPNDELDSQGARSKPLERAQRCPLFDKQTFDRTQLAAEGYQVIPGRADAPYGWTRDDRGRVFQINFDLTRRMYIGAGYTPSVQVEGEPASQQTSIDFGLFAFEFYGGKRYPNRHRLRLMEGQVKLEPFAAELVMAQYDLSRRFLEPLLRITTFVGPPRRHDLRLNLGVWTEAGHLEIHHTEMGDATLWKFGVAQLTLDVWQSSKLDSFARLRTGMGVERVYVDEAMPGEVDRSALTAGSAFEIEWHVDRAGFHNLGLEITHEIPRYFVPRPEIGTSASRIRARVQYEAIVLAINDQPVTLSVGAGAERRNDLPNVPDQWAFVADTGVRFSLWAPPKPR